MPKFGRPNSRDKRQYMYNDGSEVTRNAPFGTNFTPRFYTKIVGSRYTKINGDGPDVELDDVANNETQRSGTSSPIKENLNRRPVLPPIYSESQRDYDLTELNSLLPPGSELPTKIIELKNNEQLSLLKLIKYEIHGIPNFITKLKECYLWLAKIDVNLTGLCSFKEFAEACHQNNIHLSWKLFRVVASQFVVPNRDDAQFVHYEKIISFLGAVYRSMDQSEICIENPKKKSSKNEGCPLEKPVYFHDETCIDTDKCDKCKDPFDFDDAKTIKQISDDVGFNPIPLQRIRLAFQRTDSLHRGTMSARQIWDIFHSEGLILRKDTFDKLLSRCKYMGGGQYSWEYLVDFMERIQPISTGLQIPSSKMPSDFMRPIPAPASSWPHAEAFQMHHNVQELRPPAVQSYNTLHNNVSARSQDFSQQYSPRESPNVALHNQQIASHQVKRKDVSIKPSSPQIEPWFNRFLKFVDSVYLRDVNSQGILPTRELYDLSCSLNDQLGLNISSAEIISALEGAAVDNDRIYSNINSYLKRLSIK